MFPPMQSNASALQSLSPNVPVLGFVSLLMGMSSAMIHGVLPVFLMVVLGASTASVGFIEGIAEATTSLAKYFPVSRATKSVAVNRWSFSVTPYRRLISSSFRSPSRHP